MTDTHVTRNLVAVMDRRLLHCTSLVESLARRPCSIPFMRLAEEQRKRIGDRGGKARLLTFALSEQMCDSDEDEDEDEYSQKSAEERVAEEPLLAL